jgi:hypothetical protein
MIPQSATVTGVGQLVHGRLEPGDLVHAWLNGSEILCDESFEDYWLAGLFVLIADDTPPDEQYLQQLLAGKAGIAPHKHHRPLATSRSAQAGRRLASCGL